MTSYSRGRGVSQAKQGSRNSKNDMTSFINGPSITTSYWPLPLRLHPPPFQYKTLKEPCNEPWNNLNMIYSKTHMTSFANIIICRCRRKNLTKLSFFAVHDMLRNAKLYSSNIRYCNGLSLGEFSVLAADFRKFRWVFQFQVSFVNFLRNLQNFSWIFIKLFLKLFKTFLEILQKIFWNSSKIFLKFFKTSSEILQVFL